MKKILLIAFMFAGFAAQASYADDAVLYLVRHAEKQADSDPALTELGIKRAEALAERLMAAKLSRVYSTDYKRTRQTAAPTAQQKGLDITLYDPRAFNEFAEALRTEFLGQADSILVVGHSNTTPYLATLLTGTEYPMLNEDQYDHLYVIKKAEDGSLIATIEYFNP